MKGRSGTKPGGLLKHQIPIRTFADWDDTRPGFVEVDLVGHEGGNPRGEFAQTLTVTDVATGWTENAAVRNKAQRWVFEALTGIRARLPFPLLGIDSDNGAEFINDQLLRYCTAEGITFTRGRTSTKKDNCYVEQKNWAVVRRAVRYLRYDTPAELAVLNELYARRPLATFIDEAEGRARSWGEDEIRWWVADNGLVGDEQFLLARGGKLCDTYHLLARIIDEVGPAPETTEVVADRVAYDAVVTVETTGWGRAPLDPASVEEGFAEYVRALEDRQGFAILATIDGVPAAAGRCRMYGEVSPPGRRGDAPRGAQAGRVRTGPGGSPCAGRGWGATLALTRARPSTSAPILARAGFERYRIERCYSGGLNEEPPTSQPSGTS